MSHSEIHQWKNKCRVGGGIEVGCEGMIGAVDGDTREFYIVVAFHLTVFTFSESAFLTLIMAFIFTIKVLEIIMRILQALLQHMVRCCLYHISLPGCALPEDVQPN